MARPGDRVSFTIDVSGLDRDVARVLRSAREAKRAVTRGQAKAVRLRGLQITVGNELVRATRDLAVRARRGG